MWALLPIQIVIAPVHGAVINKVNDTSKNLLPIDFLMPGEPYHNNHHKFGGRANFGICWYEFDPVYPVINLFDKIGIIKLKMNNDLNYM